MEANLLEKEKKLCWYDKLSVLRLDADLKYHSKIHGNEFFGENSFHGAVK